MLHHSCAQDEKFLFVLKNIVSGIYSPPMHGQLITAAVLQFPLDFSSCPKTGTLCVKVGTKPVFIPLSNICIQSYNFPDLLVEYIINMQQDLSALFSQSLGASSNSENKNCATVVENCLYFYCSDHDLCLFFNEVLDKPRCQ